MTLSSNKTKLLSHLLLVQINVQHVTPFNLQCGRNEQSSKYMLPLPAPVARRCHQPCDPRRSSTGRHTVAMSQSGVVPHRDLPCAALRCKKVSPAARRRRRCAPPRSPAHCSLPCAALWHAPQRPPVRRAALRRTLPWPPTPPCSTTRTAAQLAGDRPWLKQIQHFKIVISTFVFFGSKILFL